MTVPMISLIKAHAILQSMTYNKHPKYVSPLSSRSL